MTIRTITFDDTTHALVPRHVVSEAASAFADLGWHESLARAKELLAAAPHDESQGDRITEAKAMQTARLIEMGQLATVDPDGQRADYPMALLLTFDDADSIRAAIREGKVGFVFGDEPMPSNDAGNARGAAASHVERPVGRED